MPCSSKESRVLKSDGQSFCPPHDASYPCVFFGYLMKKQEYKWNKRQQREEKKILFSDFFKYHVVMKANLIFVPVEICLLF